MKEGDPMPDTATATPVTAALSAQFQFIASAVSRNLDGISEEEAIVRPDPGVNSVNWLLGHMLTVRQSFLGHFGIGPLLTPESTAQYKRGAQPGDYAPETLASLTGTFGRAQEELLSLLSRLDEDDLAKPAPFSPTGAPETVGSLLGRMVVHESYHTGQTGTLRRLLGKKGAIG
jgi:uncharacterized damage-inducible protein DinB